MEVVEKVVIDIVWYIWFVLFEKGCEINIIFYNVFIVVDEVIVERFVFFFYYEEEGERCKSEGNFRIGYDWFKVK